ADAVRERGQLGDDHLRRAGLDGPEDGAPVEGVAHDALRAGGIDGGGPRRRSRRSRHLMAGRHQNAHERTAQRAGRAGDENPHDTSTSTTTGAWSDGSFPLRASRSTYASLTASANAADAYTRSMRIPWFLWNIPAR